jgi:hypothetical protein
MGADWLDQFYKDVPQFVKKAMTSTGNIASGWEQCADPVALLWLARHCREPDQTTAVRQLLAELLDEVEQINNARRHRTDNTMANDPVMCAGHDLFAELNGIAGAEPRLPQRPGEGRKLVRDADVHAYDSALQKARMTCCEIIRKELTRPQVHA